MCSFISMTLHAFITYLSSFFTCKWNTKLYRNWLVLQMQDRAFLYNTFHTWRFPEIPVLDKSITINTTPASLEGELRGRGWGLTLVHSDRVMDRYWCLLWPCNRNNIDFICFQLCWCTHTHTDQYEAWYRIAISGFPLSAYLKNGQYFTALCMHLHPTVRFS
jgi:hypothetical protein